MPASCVNVLLFKTILYIHFPQNTIGIKKEVFLYNILVATLQSIKFLNIKHQINQK